MSMQILVADDDPVIARMLVAGLRTCGWQVQVAVDAMQAFMFALRNQPDAIVLDINMPGGTGLKTLGQLRASSKTAHIPVAVLTGLTDPTLAATVASLGAQAFLAKPVDPEKLLDALQRMLGVTV
jgi:CheY-like chemotaxis protein